MCVCVPRVISMTYRADIKLTYYFGTLLGVAVVTPHSVNGERRFFDHESRPPDYRELS